MHTGSPPGARDDLIAAYHGTSYRVVHADGEIAAEVWVGLPSATIDAVLSAHSAGCGVFITAWNPRSVPQPRSVNDAAHNRLAQELKQRRARYLPHFGVGADPAWTEHGAFVLDIEIAEALALATAYEQNAIVAIAIGEPARLLLTDLVTP